MNPDQDIMELIVQVMLAAAKDNSDELRELMKEMQRTLDEKKRQSELAQEVLDAVRESEQQEAHTRHVRVSVELPKALAKDVRDKVESGLYLDSSEAIRDALRGQIRCSEQNADLVDVNRLGLALFGLAGDSKRELAKGLDAISDVRDSLSELGESEQLRLQLLMDRMTKANEAISNILKKLSETQACIAKNIK